MLAGLLAVALTVGAGALAPQGRLTSRADPSPHAVDPCAEDPPVLAVVCNGPMRAHQRTTAVMAVLDRPSASSDYPLATTEQVGAVWALANSWVEPALYVAAYHKRAHGFGPGGPGQIYRVDFRLGAVSPFLVVPGVGADSHSRASLTLDEDGRDGAGKRSLGGMALSDDGAELFVVNLYDRQIYRFDRASGRLMGQLAHGAAALPWAADARPFALAYRDGWLYHGVVNSAESSQRAGDLRAHVYASRADGTELREVLELPLDYPRGVARVAGVAAGPPVVDVPLAWNPWKDGYNRAALAQLAIYPQPVLADIAFSAAGDMLVGLRDRQSDVALGQQMIQPSVIEKPGLGVGDLILARRQGDGWAPVLPDGRGGEPYSDVTALADGSVTGGLASLVGLDAVVAGAVAPSAMQVNVVEQSLTWFRESDGRRLRRHDLACDVFTQPTPVPFARLLPAPPVAHADDEWSPVTDVGDVEALRCRAPATATPSLTPAPTDTPTPTTTPTSTVTPTVPITPVPSATPTRPAYLPVTLSERCVPGQQHSDVVLVLDASESMLNPTAAGRPKIEAAKDAVRAFLRLVDLGSDQAALVWFNAQAGTALGLSVDPAALVAAIEAIPVRGGTRIHLGLDEARRLLTGPGRRAANTPVVVLLSDGRSVPDPPALAVAAAGQLKAAGVAVFTVGLGGDVDAAEMAALATSPDHFRRAADGEDLRSVYQRIARELPCPGERFFPHPPGPPSTATGPKP